MAANEREITADMLVELENGGQSNRILEEHLAALLYLPKHARAFISRVFLGTTERQITIDAVLASFSKTPVRKMKPLVRAILRMSVYQILYLDRVPDSAVTNEAVKLMRKRGLAGLSGFVNGVLRSVCRKKAEGGMESLLPDPADDGTRALSIRYSMPEWLVGYFQREYGKEDAIRLMEAFLRPRPVIAAVNTAMQSTEDLIGILTEEGIEAHPHPYLDTALVLDSLDALEFSDAFAEGRFYIQDIASQIAVHAAGIRPGEKILDTCAAPGGKTVMAAMLTGPDGHVTSGDLTERKVAYIQENVDRLCLKNVTARVYDAAVTDPEHLEAYDLLICDVPCSGLGSIGRKPEIRYRISEEGFRELAKTGRQILAASLPMLKPGGKLLFTTCTLTTEENEETAAWLREEMKMEPVPFADRICEKLLLETGEEAEKGYLRLIPGRSDADGFFISLFQKAGQET